MEAAVARQLIDLNKEFYQKLAAPFSATRGRLQPGVQRILQEIPLDMTILDIGCGNGGVAAELKRRSFTGNYAGLDFSEELLQVARSRVKDSNFSFSQADLTSAGWPKDLEPRYDLVLAFAVLHHIPSPGLRLGVLKQVRRLVGNGGRFIHSNWQFLNSARLRARIQPWEAVGLDAADVDEGDYLLDWRGGEVGLRYVHHFTEGELATLAAEAGFLVAHSFLADGENGRLGLYQTWKVGQADIVPPL